MKNEMTWVCAAALVVCGACGDGEELSPQATAEELERPSAVSPTCVPPADCLPVSTTFFTLGVCCSETLRCGLDLSSGIELFGVLPEEEGREYDATKPCWPRAYMYIDIPRMPAERVAGTAGDILLTPDCTAREVAKTPLPGCCLPDNTCGLSTHIAGHTFSLFLDNSTVEPFTGKECVSPSQLNQQFAASKLASFAHAPASRGTCDYAALSAQLPPN